MFGLFTRPRPAPPTCIVTGGRRELRLTPAAAARYLREVARWQPVVIGLLFAGGPPATVDATDAEGGRVRVVVVA